MYIQPFWCGVAATIIFEVLSIVVLAIVFALKDGAKEAKQILDGEEGKNVHKDD